MALQDWAHQYQELGVEFGIQAEAEKVLVFFLPLVVFILFNTMGLVVVVAWKTRRL